jgi:hypothetical protein
MLPRPFAVGSKYTVQSIPVIIWFRHEREQENRMDHCFPALCDCCPWLADCFGSSRGLPVGAALGLGQYGKMHDFRVLTRLAEPHHRHPPPTSGISRRTSSSEANFTKGRDGVTMPSGRSRAQGRRQGPPARRRTRGRHRGWARKEMGTDKTADGFFRRWSFSFKGKDTTRRRGFSSAYGGALGFVKSNRASPAASLSLPPYPFSGLCCALILPSLSNPHARASVVDESEGSRVIRLKYIYNFWCSMLVYVSFALCFVTLRGVFMHFLKLTY